MRIRRRAPASQAPDPSLQLQAPANGSQGTSEHPSGGVTLAGLHPDVDLTIDPQPSCIPSQDPSLVQVVGEIKEEVKKKVDVDANKMGDFHVNSNNKSTGAGRVLGERKAKAKAAISSRRSDDQVIVTSVKEEDEEYQRVKKRRSPAVLMEGSRCSRVNGRGWRCCQQTLVGYSLCEHHLGKGRLRSMSSVRGQLGTTKPVKASSQANAEVLMEDIVASSSLTEKMKKSLETSNAAEDDENLESKCKKIGMVKARSISSLLG
ncbi:hypothetical protein J5N97_005671 [Dioscorea zingiberensis]|uniref:WRC domain-containing protein n=1 Tax=Dioscorea zingiberensis TaxID=325984 RepID=A0A9D5HS39_9LILI|nr:hypothetical protein J5N97_005671 [Dioscorea zingiberensis]